MIDVERDVFSLLTAIINDHSDKDSFAVVNMFFSNRERSFDPKYPTIKVLYGFSSVGSPSFLLKENIALNLQPFKLFTGIYWTEDNVPNSGDVDLEMTKVAILQGFIAEGEEIRYFTGTSTKRVPQLPSQYMLLLDLKKARAYVSLYETDYYTSPLQESIRGINVDASSSKSPSISGFKVVQNERTFLFADKGNYTFESGFNRKYIVFKMLYEAKGNPVPTQSIIDTINRELVKHNEEPTFGKKQCTSLISSIRQGFKNTESSFSKEKTLDDFVKIIGVGKSKKIRSAFKLEITA